MKKTDLQSGERLIPTESSPLEWGEHASRYLFAAQFCRGLRVLDAGCGVGYGSDLLIKNGAHSVTGVDASSEAITYARHNYRHPALSFESMPVGQLLFPNASFDAAILLEVIEHLDQPDDCLREIKRILKPGGVLIISTPNQAEHPGQLFNPYHVKEYTSDTFLALLSNFFRQNVLYGLGFNSGCTITPVRQASFEKAQVDTRLATSLPEEPPFFIAVCADQLSVRLPSNPVIFPFQFERKIVNQIDENLVSESLRQEIGALFLLRFTDESAFRFRCERLSPPEIIALKDSLRQLIQNQAYHVAASLLESLIPNPLGEGEWTYLLAYSLHMDWLSNRSNQANPTQVLNTYTQAMQRGHDPFWVHYHRASLLQQLGDFPNGLSTIQEALSIHPDDEDAKQLQNGILKDQALTWLVQARKLVNEQKPREAMPYLQRCLNNLPADPEAHYLTALTLQAVGDKMELILTHYQQALDNGFDEFWVRYQRGALYLARGDAQQAYLDLKSAVSLNPQHSGAQDLLNIILSERNNPF